MPFLSGVLRVQSLQSVLVFNFTNKHAMSYWSEYLPCSCRVNISEPGVCFTVLLLSAVCEVGLPSFQFPTAMSDSHSLNTSLLEVMISSKNECLFNRVLCDLPLQIIFDAWWASMNVGPKRHIAWYDSRHAASWWCYLDCGIEETGSPCIICIVCHQVLRHPSEHGTSRMGKHLLAKAHIAKSNELTESQVTEWTRLMVDDTALALVSRHGSPGITISSLRMKIIFDIQVDPYWPKWQRKHSIPAAKDFKTSKFHRDTSNHYLMLGFESAHIPWNAISNLELWWSHRASCDDLGLPSATTLNNICRREYALTVNAIMKKLPPRNNVSLVLDRWTSTNKLALTSVIQYYMDRYWALHEDERTFDEIDHLFFSCLER